MTVYITYDRLAYNKKFTIIDIQPTLKEVRKTYKDNLFNFISSDPDDNHSYQIQKVTINREDYKKLLSFKGGTSSDKDFTTLMSTIYDQPNEDNVILFTDGGSDNCELVKYVCDRLDKDYGDDDEYMEVLLILHSKKEYSKYLKSYINATYKI